MKHALLAASLVLVAGSGVACGGEGGSSGASSEDAPSDASTADFCGVFDDFYQVVGELGAEAENSELIAALKDTGEDLEQVGTPEDISEEGRAGFELTVQTIEDLDEDATEKDLEDLEKDFSEEETAQSEAFDKYLSETCQEPTGETPEEPTEEPSE